MARQNRSSRRPQRPKKKPKPRLPPRLHILTTDEGIEIIKGMTRDERLIFLAKVARRMPKKP